MHYASKGELWPNPKNGFLQPLNYICKRILHSMCFIFLSFWDLTCFSSHVDGFPFICSILFYGKMQHIELMHMCYALDSDVLAVGVMKDYDW